MRKVKVLITLFLVFSLMFSGCASKTTTIDLAATQQEIKFAETQATESTVTEAQSTETSEKESADFVLFDHDVEIVLTMVSFDSSQTIEDYIANLQKENPDSIYAVYDDSHYTQTIKESKRKETVELMKTEEYISEAFQEFFSDEQYNGAFVSMEYDELFQNVTFYADKVAYESAGLMVVFGPVLLGGIFGDMVQAYNLVPVEERYVTIQIVDNQTSEVLYDSSAE